MRPLISYYGGKQRMVSKIIPYIPKHTVYAEPFCGGASLMFAKPWPNFTNKDNYRECINDTSEQLINMYRIFQTRFDDIQHLLVNTLYSEAEHKKAKQICNEEITDELWLAWAYYVNIQMSFSRSIGNGWGRSLFGRNEATTWVSKITNLDKFRQRMASVHISCTDALKFIKQWDSPQTFFYCDPPYPGTDQRHYKGYTQIDFDNLITTLNECQGAAIVSCYKQDNIPDGWHTVSFESYCSGSGRGRVDADRSRKAKTEEIGKTKRVEYLYIKPASVKVRPEIQKLYDSGKYDCFKGAS